MIASCLNYLGHIDMADNLPKKGNKGDVITRGMKTWVFDGEKWQELSYDDPLSCNSSIPHKKPIKNVVCRCCHASLPIHKAVDGVVKCEFCRSLNLVWEAKE